MALAHFLARMALRTDGRRRSRDRSSGLGAGAGAAERRPAGTSDHARAGPDDDRALGGAVGAGRDATSLVARDVPDRRTRASSVIELLPTMATFAPGEEVEVEVRGGASTVTLTYLGDPLAHAVVAGDGVARFGPLAEGGYGVEADGAHSALDVLADPLTRPRYGFVSHYEPARDAAGVVENARRLHLNVVQFYDWMYRHARLLPPSETFTDALGQPLSLASVRRLAAALSGAGSLPLGYAAVYAAGADEWPDWRDQGLYRADGEPWMLADFLWILDP